MQIDWLTVVAQIVNFLLLVWLLRWALYRPLSRTVQARKDEVARRLTDAETARAEAEAAAAAHREATSALERNRANHLKRAEEDATVIRTEMIDAAKAEIATRRADWHAELDDEKAAFLDRLRYRAGKSFVAVARNVLTEMADQDLIDRMALVFAARLAELDAGDRAKLHKAAAAGVGLHVLSSLPLSTEAQKVVGKAVRQLMETEDEIVFEQSPDLECGIILRVGSRHVGWTIGENLDAFEQEVARLLDTDEVEAGA